MFHCRAGGADFFRPGLEHRVGSFFDARTAYVGSPDINICKKAPLGALFYLTFILM